MITLLLLALLLAPAPITLTTRDLYQFEPATIRLTLRIDRDARNRQWCVGWEGGEAGATCREMAGDKAPVTEWITLKDVTAGEYRAVAQVQRVDGTTAQAEVRWEVLARH